MVKHQLNKLSKAVRLLKDCDGTSDPGQKLKTIEKGLDLLIELAGDNLELDRDTETQIKDLRSTYAKRLLTSLPDVQGVSIGQQLEFARILLLKMKPEVEAVLADSRRNAMILPRPQDGGVIEISPPGLTWVPMQGAFEYRIEIQDNAGRLIHGKNVGKDPVHLPDRVLPLGAYTWDVIALDAQRNERSRRGIQSFTIAGGADELPWVEPETLLDRVPKEHPRFIYTKRGLPSIIATLETRRKRSWKACLRAAEYALNTPPPIYPNYNLTKDVAQSRLECGQFVEEFKRSIDGALMDLSLAYLMTGEAKYSEAGKRILLEIADWPRDDNDVTSVSAKWGDEVGLSIARCGHRAYDWLYNALSEKERAKVSAMCEARAWQVHRRLIRHNYLSYPGESHNGRLIGFLAEMAIVMAGESEGAGTWLRYSLKALTTLFPHWGGDDGGWSEGTAYGLWYSRHYIPAIESLKATTGFDLWKRPFFQKLRYFFFYCAPIRGEISPFGDGAERVGPGRDGGSGYASMLWHHAHRFDDPYISWWVNQIEGWNGSGGELSLLFGDSLRAKPPTDLPGSRVFQGVGWAAMHSDLSHPNEDTFLLFKSSPFGSASHSHGDQNAFCIMKGGKALAIPSGYYGPSAWMPHHAEWTHSTKANNCVLVNGGGQAILERRAKGRIKAFEDREGLSYVVGEAAAAYMGELRRFDRHILFLRPGLFILLDDLESPSPARFQWMLHAFEKMEIDNSIGQVVSRRSGATLEIRLRSPAGLVFSQTDGFDTPYNAGVPEGFRREMPNQWHTTVETKQKSKSVRIGAVMAVRGHDEDFELNILEQVGWFGARATGVFGTVEGWVQLLPNYEGPAGYGVSVREGKQILCGRTSNGDLFIR